MLSRVKPTEEVVAQARKPSGRRLVHSTRSVPPTKGKVYSTKYSPSGPVRLRSSELPSEMSNCSMSSRNTLRVFGARTTVSVKANRVSLSMTFVPRLESVANERS